MTFWYLAHGRLWNILCRARLKRDGTCAETRFGLSEKWTSPFKLAGESVQSTAGSRGARISRQTIDRPCSEVQRKSSGYPLQSPISPSLPLPRVTVCHHVSNGLYILQVTVSLKQENQTTAAHIRCIVENVSQLLLCSCYMLSL